MIQVNTGSARFRQTRSFFTSIADFMILFYNEMKKGADDNENHSRFHPRPL